MTETQDAQRAATAAAEPVQRFARVRVDCDRLEQLGAQGEVPRWPHARRVHIEVEAHEFEPRAARARHRRQQLAKGQVRAIGSLPWAAWVVVRCLHP